MRRDAPGDLALTASVDAGGFYCEHALYVALAVAGPSVGRDEAGEPLVGFLHVPDDPQTYGDGHAVHPLDRHADTVVLLGTAIRGWLDAIGPVGPARLLVTGFGAWHSARGLHVVNNPTGEVVTAVDVLDAAVAIALGSPVTGRVVHEPLSRAFEIAGRGRGASGSAEVTATVRRYGDVLEVAAVRLPVADQAIDGGAGSVQAAISAFAPAAVLCTGVVSDGVIADRPFRVETVASDRGLAMVGGGFRHHSEQRASRLVPTRALWRALGGEI